jgi:hypothetical protein
MKIDTSCKERKCHAIVRMCDHLLWRSCWRFTLYLPIYLPEATRPDRGQGHDGFCVRRVLTHTWTFQTRSERLAESFRRPRAHLIFTLHESGIVQHIDTPANVVHKAGYGDPTFRCEPSNDPPRTPTPARC